MTNFRTSGSEDVCGFRQQSWLLFLGSARRTSSHSSNPRFRQKCDPPKKQDPACLPDFSPERRVRSTEGENMTKENTKVTNRDEGAVRDPREQLLEDAYSKTFEEASVSAHQEFIALAVIV